MSDEKEKILMELTGYGLNELPCECVADDGYCECGNTCDCAEAFYWKGVNDTLEKLFNISEDQNE